MLTQTITTVKVSCKLHHCHKWHRKRRWETKKVHERRCSIFSMSCPVFLSFCLSGCLSLILNLTLSLSVSLSHGLDLYVNLLVSVSCLSRSIFLSLSLSPSLSLSLSLSGRERLLLFLFLFTRWVYCVFVTTVEIPHKTKSFLWKITSVW